MTIDELKTKYGLFNTLFFSSSLPHCGVVKIRLSGSEICAGYTMPNHLVVDGEERGAMIYPENVRYIIKLNDELLKDEKEYNSVLCHEMIHIWQMEIINPSRYTEKGKGWGTSHDKVFESKMKTINYMCADELGIPMDIGLVYNEKGKKGSGPRKYRLIASDGFGVTLDGESYKKIKAYMRDEFDKFAKDGSYKTDFGTFTTDPSTGAKGFKYTLKDLRDMMGKMGIEEEK